MVATLASILLACDGESKDSSKSESDSETDSFLPRVDIVQLMARVAAAFGSGGGGLDVDDTWESTWAQLEERLGPWSELKGDGAALSGSALTVQDVPLGDVDLRAFDTEVKDQGKEGLCTSFAVIAGLENIAQSQGTYVDVSERDLWSKYERYNLRSAIIAALNNPVFTESFEPIAVRGSKDLARESFGQARITSAREIELKDVYEALAAHHPVVFATETTRPFFDRNGIVNPYNPTTDLGHAMLVVGMVQNELVDGGAYLIAKNSWGPEKGDRGYVYIPLAQCRLHDCRFYAVEAVEVTKTGEWGGPVPTSDQAPDSKESKSSDKDESEPSDPIVIEDSEETVVKSDASDSKDAASSP